LHLIKCFVQFGDQVFPRSGVDSAARYAEKGPLSVTERFYHEVEMTGHALECEGNFGARSHPGAKDFLFDGCCARALFLAQDFGVSAAEKATLVPGPEALSVSAAEKVPVVPSRDERSDPRATQLQVLSEEYNGRMFEGSANRRRAYNLTGFVLDG
jgi:hypothetical protein